MELRNFTGPVELEDPESIGYHGTVALVRSQGDPSGNEGTYAVVTVDDDLGLSSAVFFTNEAGVPIFPFPLLEQDGADREAMLTRLDDKFDSMLLAYTERGLNVTEEEPAGPGSDLT